MKPIVYLITGVSGSGKDTFVKMVDDRLSPVGAVNLSTVDPIKEFLDGYGVPRDRSYHATRKLISDIKILLENYANLTSYHTVKTVKKLINDGLSYKTPIFIHVREQEHIDKLKELFKTDVIVQVVKLVRSQAMTNVPDNEGDKGALTVKADITIANNGNMESLNYSALAFCGRHYITLAEHYNASKAVCTVSEPQPTERNYSAEILSIWDIDEAGRVFSKFEMVEFVSRSYGAWTEAHIQTLERLVNNGDVVKCKSGTYSLI